MTAEQKLKKIAKYIDEFISDTDNLDERFFTKEEIQQVKGARHLALELAIHYHLEENL